MFYGETTKCPICGKTTTEEYCKDCLETVSRSAEWLEEELRTDWERVVDVMGYFYEKNC